MSFFHVDHYSNKYEYFQVKHQDEEDFSSKHKMIFICKLRFHYKAMCIQRESDSGGSVSLDVRVGIPLYDVYRGRNNRVVQTRRCSKLGYFTIL